MHFSFLKDLDTFLHHLEVLEALMLKGFCQKVPATVLAVYALNPSANLDVIAV